MLEFEEKLAETWPTPEWRSTGVVLAVSGGADSVGLLRALARLAGQGESRLVVAHYNHGLRLPDADDDQQFVAHLCRELQIPFEVDTAAAKSMSAVQGEGLEAVARRLRYDFLENVAQKVGAGYVVTAHTADDQVETVLHRILRGTGIGGLSGIPFSRPLGPGAVVLRPLLGFQRSEVLQYLDQLGQAYRHDLSNNDTRFTRNRIRHELLPLMRESFNQQVDLSLLRLAHLAGEAQQVILDVVQQLRKRSVVDIGQQRVVLACDHAAGQPRYAVRELMISLWSELAWPQQSMGFRQWDLLAEMAQLPAEQVRHATRMFPGEVTARRDDRHLTLTRADPIESKNT